MLRVTDTNRIFSLEGDQRNQKASATSSACERPHWEVCYEQPGEGWWLRQLSHSNNCSTCYRSTERRTPQYKRVPRITPSNRSPNKEITMSELKTTILKHTNSKKYPGFGLIMSKILTEVTTHRLYSHSFRT